jgi:GH25 family lysozyme M1 (1,4-beta-N-acetylmuramidase)
VALLAMAMLPASTSAGNGRLPGIDVSRFQETINWGKVADSGIRFAFVQASRGRGGDCAVVPESCGPDEYYARNYERARKHRVRVGPYHRAFVEGSTIKRAKADARAEADVFVATVGRLTKRDLRPALDLESPFSGVNARRLRIWIRVWLRRVDKKLGPKPVIYTNTSSWAATGDTTEFARNGHRLWVANWDVRSPSVPAANWAGRGWSVWQFTSDGRVPGISGPVDRNRLRVRFSRIAAKPLKKR